MTYHIDLPGALIRRASQRAADQQTTLDRIVRSLLDLYVEEAIDPTTPDPIASAIGRRQAQRRIAQQSPEARQAAAQHAARSRWHPPTEE